ncbi:MAG TPA: hypothetical protein VFN72_02475 [Solirubrobacterales bacterium]|jgi:hypothetical protein|nr:hypothetical protein [Solirubrobacterales bacterium]
MTKTQLQALLVIGALGAGLAVVQLLGIAGGLVGVALMAFSTVLSAPAAPEPGARGLNWWALLAGGTALAVVGVPLSLLLEAPGGLLTAIGGGMAIVGVAFGYPT